MGTSTVDGTVDDVQLRRARAGVASYKSIRFALDGGGSRTVTNAVVTQAVADQLVPGRHGRYYLYTAFDVKGVHGVRRGDGTAVYGFPGNNQKVFLFLGIVNLLWVGIRIAIDGQVPLLGVGLLILSAVGYFLMNKGRREAKAQFEGDSGYIAPSAGPV